MKKLLISLIVAAILTGCGGDGRSPNTGGTVGVWCDYHQAYETFYCEWN